MFVSHHREKLINAIIFFTRNTKHCHTLKLFKLLNFLDFEHYRQTGHPVTGLKYKAWRQGPAPASLWHEFKNPQPDLAKSIAVNLVKDEITDEPLRRDIRAKCAFDPKHFTARELEIMETLAFFFAELRAENMSDFSHSRDLPWGKVFAGGKGMGREIPYELSLESAPILKDMPSLTSEEHDRRKLAFKEIEEHTT